VIFHSYVSLPEGISLKIDGFPLTSHWLIHGKKRESTGEIIHRYKQGYHRITWWIHSDSIPISGWNLPGPWDFFTARRPQKWRKPPQWKRRQRRPRKMWRFLDVNGGETPAIFDGTKGTTGTGYRSFQMQLKTLIHAAGFSCPLAVTWTFSG